MTSTNPDQHATAPQDETLQERSARLEAEAAMGKIGGDPLSPEPVPEDTPPENEQSAGGNADIETLQQELSEMREHMLRAVAETENIRKRSVREREDASKFAISSFAQDMIGVSDNLRRALEAVPDDLKSEPAIQNLVEGIEATERELLRGFDKNKIEKIDPLGQNFDPNLHEVMFETPGTGQAPGTVIQVVQTGYVIHGRLLRPARVGVAKDDGTGGQGSGSATGTTIDTEA